jgi:hypothetical protein
VSKTTHDDILRRDEQGYIWLVASEVIAHVPNPSQASPASVLRKIERYCAHGRLTHFTYEATREQQLQLLVAGRIKGFSPNGKPLYLIRRDGLAHLNEPLQSGRKLKRTYE